MIEHPYLIALALIEQKAQRAIPLGGKSLKEEINSTYEPGEKADSLVRELLIRVFQRSETAPLRRVAGERSLLLILISMEVMQSKIPLVKSQWIKTGDNEKLFSELEALCEEVWAVNFTRDEGVRFSRFR